MKIIRIWRINQTQSTKAMTVMVGETLVVMAMTVTVMDGEMMITMVGVMAMD